MIHKRKKKVFYCEIKQAKEIYIDEGTKHERIGIACLKTGIWILRGIREDRREEGGPCVWERRMITHIVKVF
jgi:hypothetical protein